MGASSGWKNRCKPRHYDTEFQNWLNWGKGQPITKTASAKRGKELMSSCVACHTMNGINDFVPRKEKYETALADFEVQNAEYQKALKIWKETPHEDGEGHFEKYKTKPIAPKVPKIYKGYLKTVAPDLTDIALRRRIISGVKENNKEHLNEWIQNPSKEKDPIGKSVESWKSNISGSDLQGHNKIKKRSVQGHNNQKNHSRAVHRKCLVESHPH